MLSRAKNVHKVACETCKFLVESGILYTSFWACVRCISYCFRIGWCLPHLWRLRTQLPILPVSDYSLTII